MSYIEFSITPNVAISATDFIGIEAMAPDANFLRAIGTPGTTVRYRVTESLFDRLRPGLDRLAARRVPAVDASGNRIPDRTRPAMTYTAELVPGGRPAPSQLEGVIDTNPAVGAALTMRGTGLVPGVKAFLIVSQQGVPTNTSTPTGVQKWNAPVDVLRVDAVMKGPIGNRIRFAVLDASGAGSVSVVERGDGVIEITVVPAAAGKTATAIAAQVNGNALASVWVTVTALSGSTVVTPFKGQKIQGPNAVVTTPFQDLAQGAGAGVAFADLLVSGTDPTNRLRLNAQKSGNLLNMVSIKLLGGQGADSVVVTGNDIVVNRMAATTALATLVSAINGNAAANLLVKAVAVGSGSLGSVEKTHLAGGSGEVPVATVGGAPATIKEHSDTSMLVTALGADLTTAGVAANEMAKVFVTLDRDHLEFDRIAVAT